MKNCPKCGANLGVNAKFCSRCGATLASATTPLVASPTPNTGESSETRPLPIPRHPSDSAPTQRLAGAVALTRLANGALLCGDRFEIVTCVEQTAARNTYVVIDRFNRRCNRCGHMSVKSPTFCESCGVRLEAEERYVLVEGFDESLLAQSIITSQIARQHPGLVKLYEGFRDSSLNRQERFYLVKEPIVVDAVIVGVQPARRVADLSPISVQQALAWTDTIAKILDSFPAAGVYLPELSSTQLLQVGGDLRVDILEHVKAYDKPMQSKIAAHHILLVATAFQAIVRGIPLGKSTNGVLNEARTAGRYPDATAFALALGNAYRSDHAVLGGLNVSVGKLTDLGLVREINEDSLLTFEIDQFHNSANAPLRLYAVADGMGGHAAGEVASKLALNQLSRALLESMQAEVLANAQAPRFDYGALLKAAGQVAAQAVYDQAQRTHSDMGTTLVATLVDVTGGRAYVINVGDSRLYKINAAGIRQISKDHSMVQLLVDKQQLSAEEARRHPQANLIYRTLGEKPNVEIDLFEEALAPGDALLLCSDGLSGLVADAKLREAVQSGPVPQAACIQLVKQAKAAGGHDNITVIVVQLSAPK